MDDFKNENFQNEPARVPIPPFPSNIPLPKNSIDIPKAIKGFSRKVLACNPFYLVSAALLLYGIYLVSNEGGFFKPEFVQLSFNFGSLELYEMLLVCTAVVLAFRRIWYDSMLLVFLENILVIAPFILISQAALIDQRNIWIACLASAAGVVLRFWVLKKFFKELNLPRRVVVLGFILLVVNVALLIVFRQLHEHKVGTKPDTGWAYETNRYCWLLLVPAVIGLVNLVPRPSQTGGLLPQRRWLPMAIFLMWCAGTGVHLYSLRYVYMFDWERMLVGPGLWALAWTVFLRHEDFMERPVPWLKNCTLILPLISVSAALLDSVRGEFTILAALNAFAYGFILFRRHGDRIALVSMLASFVGSVAGMLHQYQPSLPTSATPEHWMGLCAVSGILFAVFRSRNAWAGFIGAASAAVLCLYFLCAPASVTLAVQLPLLIFLVHSLRWNDEDHPQASPLRMIACVAWVVHTLCLANSAWPWAQATPAVAGSMVFVACLFVRFMTGTWKPMVLPVTGVLVALTLPGESAVVKTMAFSPGIVAVAFSFLLFATGTFFAVTKSRWYSAHVPMSCEAGGQTGS